MKLSLSTLLLMLAFALNSAAQSCTPSFTMAQATGNQNNLLRAYISSSTLPTTNHVKRITTYWGDGNSTSTIGYIPNNHNYTTPGTYTAKMILTLTDSANTTIYCKDSSTSTFTLSYSSCATSVSTSIQNNGVVVFTANTPAGASNMMYIWTYGDGQKDTTYNTSITHTYNYSAHFTGYLKAVDTSSQCIYYNNIYLSILNGCGRSNFSHNTNGLSVNFYSSPSYVLGKQILATQWSFGDGNSSTLPYPTHIYTSAGTYNIQLITTWGDSSNNQVYCRDTITKSITITGSSTVNGYLITDTTIIAQPAYKLWLITYDSSTQNLAAIDSLALPTTAQSPFRSYSFTNVPQGVYRVKAAITNGPTSGTGYVPTYHDSDLLWSNAKTINHVTGNTYGKHIIMQSGTITSGAGFVAGNVTQGANKGTSGGIKGMDIFLLDPNKKLIQSATTDATGSFSFSQVPNGTYIVHPEQMNYTTTDISITINNGQTSHNAINFERLHSKKTIKPVTVGITTINSNNAHFNVYPNPTNGIVNININRSQSNSENTITITDVTGKDVLIATTKNNNIQLELNSLQKGLYFITIKAGKNTQTQKLLLQ